MGYRHRQQSSVVTVVLVVALVALAVVMFVTDDGTNVMGLISAVVALLTLLSVVFSRLTVVVDDRSISARFGWGWPARRIDVADVASVRRVRNRWYHGWGIRWISGGWMYNVAGFDAVELELRGGKLFRIGTDEPEALESAIEDALAPV